MNCHATCNDYKKACEENERLRKLRRLDAAKRYLVPPSAYFDGAEGKNGKRW